MKMWRALCCIQFIILLIAFTYLGLTPSPEKSIPIFNDKLMHFSGYFVAACSISFAHPTRSILLRAAFLILYSISIEIGQHFMPPRTFDVFDIVANSCGALTGLAIIYALNIHIPCVKRLLHAGIDPA